ncbi:MAG: homocysteine S-methyltransferase family protein [Leptospirales bacterium]|nr:homocysteine S-methyltransferase family protein [Leptospirales bacterium]
MNIADILSPKTPLVMDGGMGSMLFQKIPEYSGCFELLNTENPNALYEIHMAYLEAGARLIETNTFGANPLKLAEFGLDARCRELNAAGAANARKAADKYGGFVGGSIGPTGLLIEPMGEISAETVYDAFAEQVKGLREGGADLIIIETMNDIQEARLALIAAKDSADLPVICSMTFGTDGRTMTGSDVFTAFSTLAACGADALGANCGMGPDALAKIFRDNLPEISKLGLPLCEWSNAGLPKLVAGRTVYDLEPESFAAASLAFIEMGISIIGGCCGTTPAHIAALAKSAASAALPQTRQNNRRFFLTSRTKTLDADAVKPLFLGERLNPTVRKNFASDLKEGRQTCLREESRKQVEEGAHVLDINVGLPGIDEVKAMRTSVSVLCNTVDIPLMIDSDNPSVLESGLMVYPGVPIINSVNGKKESLDSILPIVRRFGCFVVALCIDETGIHREAEKRIAIGGKIIERIVSEGIDSSRVIVDAVMLAESAESGSAAETLKVIEHFAGRGIKTSVGLSNISFGLPQRKYINNVFLSMACEKGLAAAIVNPASAKIISDYREEEKLALDFLTGKDPGASAYIAHFKNFGEVVTEKKIENENIIDRLKRAVIDGDPGRIEELLPDALKEYSPKQLMDDALIAALESVGEKYSTGEYFLPQMISAAGAMKQGFHILKPLLVSSGGSEPKGRVIICTVKGDIHDIGKNMVAMMLENHGFEVHDLGKDIAAETVIEEALKLKPDIICLSSLLTTTMPEMEKVSSLLKANGLSIPLMVGGAVVNNEYAEEIGAHYSEDAALCVEKAKKLLGAR